MHPTVKRMRKAIQHISGAWCRRCAVYEDGRRTERFKLIAGRSFSNSMGHTEPVAHALQEAGFVCEWNGKPGTSGEFVIDVFEPRYCDTCNRDTKAPLFDGCMRKNCPRGFEPCL